MTMRYPMSLALVGVLFLAGVAPAAVNYVYRYRNNYKPQAYPPPVKHDASDKAQQELTKATTDASKAQDTLNGIVPKLRKEFEASASWQSAQADLKAAQAEYDAARAPVLDALRQTPAYAAARDAKDKAEADRNAVVNDPASTTEQRMAAATAVLNAGTAVTKMEAEALAANTKVTAAHEKLIAANNKVQSLEKEFDASIRSNSDWKAARKAVDDANAKLAAAKLALQQAQAKEAQAESQRQDRIHQIDEQNRAHGYPTYNQ
ncbi:MAG: hypothetical protein ACHRHE_23475 [Tepidisphaerales bacterium]